MREPLIELTGVTRRFRAGDEETTVLRDVDLTIESGEFVAIVGASGSGKSTLMNILGCLDRPSAGSYKVGGVDTGTLSHDDLARLRRERFGFIFQRYHLLPRANAIANVEMPAIYVGMAREARRERARALLARLGLAERGSHRPAELSGGQQQRVGIARALMNGGDVILADEPTGALDSASGDEVIAILRELNALGHTVIVVTHDPHVASHASRIVEISDGAVTADGANVPSAAAPPKGRTYQGGTAPHDDATAAAARAVPTSERLGRGRTGALARFAEAAAMACSALLAHRLRTLLTMLGIVIGITSVVSIVAAGEGAKRYMLEEISRMGANTISVYPGRDWGDSLAESIQTLVAADANALREEPYVDSVTPLTSRSMLLRYGNVDVNARVSGVSESNFRVSGDELAAGIAFGAEEVRRYAQVVVIDSNTRRKLFGEHVDPLGKVVLIDNVPCVVIGVRANMRGSFFIDNTTLNVWVPYTTASARLFGQRHVEGIVVRVRAGQPSEAAEQSITELLTRRHGRKDFFTYNLDSVIKTMNKTGQALTLLLSLIAVVSLVVGGIGVMNIMLVSVTERTREIGIRMAVGARRGDVMCQFLVEAVLVCLMGGAIGIALSFGASFVLEAFVDNWRMVFSANTLVAAVVSSTLVGVVFGFAPARNAARLDPVVALARD
ncbi:macrolide transport system ATP-binding/permease protein [Trinickia symbiotica]|uniref:MacB family efflux pump subunit n=1 Tax=Trinickia symbiotica TaxID=863227 RepID=A0A2N7WSC2_9BURK|nr:MacB family efflux pump subunit [Trinickia symbiotica]PMS32241.1 MacB family efflux pump subunit [Trinickia symbiotica]PPK45199.1 macrolide transport system ATP-binding/permease protein [Trinickia symbiotica]